MIGSSLAIVGCVEDDDLGEPEDIFMEIESVETRENEDRENWEFLILEVEMTNEKSDSLRVDENDFEIEESSEEGLIYGPPYQSEDVPHQILSDETREFTLVFEIREDDEAEILWFNPPEDEPLSWTSVPAY